MPLTGQDVIKFPMGESKILNTFTSIGICTGFTGGFIDYTTRGKQSLYIELIKFTQETPDLGIKIKKYIENSEPKFLLSTEEKLYKKILKLFKKMQYYQDKQLTQFDITSQSLYSKKQKPLTNVYKDELIYTTFELTTYLSELQYLLKTEKSPIAIDICLLSSNMSPLITHDVGLSYLASEDMWLLADINCLSVELTHESKKGSEIKKTTLLTLKSDKLALFIKYNYFTTDQYISAYVNVFTRETDRALQEIQEKFKHFRKMQDIFSLGITDLAERSALHDGENITELAAINNDLDKIKQFKKLMVKKNLKQENLLHIAAFYSSDEVLKFLLEQKEIPIDEMDINGMTPAYMAANIDNVKLLEILFENGANLDSEALDGCRPLHVAAAKNSVAVMEFLLKPEYKININHQIKSGATAASLAASENHIAILELLKKSGANFNIPEKKSGYEPIHVAAESDSAAAIEFLIKAGINPDSVTSKQSFTALHVAAACNSLSSIGILTKYDADINKEGINKFTPLHAAVCQGNIETVRTFIKLGADILAETEDGYTAISYALRDKILDKAILLLLNVPFKLIDIRTKNLICEYGRPLLDYLSNLCTIAVSSNMNKIKFLQQNIFMLMHESNKLLYPQYTPMLKLIGIFKQKGNKPEASLEKRALKPALTPSASIIGLER